MAIRGDWTTNEVLTSDDLNDTVNDKLGTSSLGTAIPGTVFYTASAGTALEVSRADHRHSMSADLMIEQEWTSSSSPSFTNLTIGNGTASTRYTRSGRLIVCEFYLTIGSTTTISGDFAWGSPVGMSEVNASAAVGQVVAEDNDTGNYYTGTAFSSTSPNRVYTYSHASPATLWDATTPFTWTTSDKLWAMVTFEAEY